MARKPTILKQDLERLYVVAGLSARAVAAELGVSKAGVFSALERCGIPRRTQSAASVNRWESEGLEPIDFDLVQTLVTKGWSAAKIARQLGVGYRRLQASMKAQGIARVGKGGPAPKLDVEVAIQMSDRGSTYSEIAEMFGMSLQGVSMALLRSGYRAPKRRTRKRTGRSVDGSRTKVLRILLEDNPNACWICGEDRALDMAHIVADKDGGPTEPWNTLLLCPTHHRLQEKGLLSAEESAMVEDRVNEAWATWDTLQAA